ncbi:hypothetical protein MLD38_024387 [Melastoma candidum]|uniref:Uncharacterized protein n=1 Tax=Melastoma candidum TaxID=119954 RepID=A0ACB9NT21_9MYRT|nr:hypothetical protein MLD38_024387 [Melastoma candidum]
MGIQGNDFHDDPYYADLERWILKLMADDDEAEDCAVTLGADGRCRNGSFSMDRRMDMTGTYAQSGWGSITIGGNAGTGVFIPRIKDFSMPTPEQGTKDEKRCGRQKEGRGKRNRVPSGQEGTTKSPPRSIKTTSHWF